MTSERGEVIFSVEETTRIGTAIAARIVEAFRYQPISEIAFLLKTNTEKVRSFLEGEEFPSIEMLLSIRRTTGVSIDWLLTGEGAKYVHSRERLPISNEMEIVGFA